MQVADDRHTWGDPHRGLVDRGQVVQVQHVGARGADRMQRLAPGGHLALVLVVVERGEDAVRCVRPVLV